jgi:hypothetical protein
VQHRDIIPHRGLRCANAGGRQGHANDATQRTYNKPIGARLFDLFSSSEKPENSLRGVDFERPQSEICCSQERNHLYIVQGRTTWLPR